MTLPTILMEQSPLHTPSYNSKSFWIELHRHLEQVLVDVPNESRKRDWKTPEYKVRNAKVACHPMVKGSKN